MEQYVISNSQIKMVDVDITALDPFINIEERITKLDNSVNKTIRANMINKKKKFRVRRYKSYYGRI